MALKLVTAPPGTGKTLLLIKMIFEYLKQGRRVYSNISSLKIEEVLPISSTADWRDLPDGSVVIYDEAHEHPAFSKEDIIDFPEFEDFEPEQLENENITTYKARVARVKKVYDRHKKRHYESIKDIARALKMHRHWGYDIILATQDSSDLNTRTTNIVGEHYHLIRPFGLKGNTLFFWRRHVSSPDSTAERSKAEWKKHINFNKSYFNLYHSANVHTHKASIPLKYIIVGLIILGLCCLPFYLISNNKSLKMLQGKESIATSKATDTNINQPMPNSPEALAAFQKEQLAQQEREKNIQQQREIYTKNQERQHEQEISGCVLYGGHYTAVDEYARPIHNKSHLCKQVIQNADRNAMKKPRRQTYNNYSSDAQAELNNQELVQEQREFFNEP
ncbi:MAG: zonular occludens toxin domain-containing protein [Vagococcus sp.]|jgi:zona occludens toxin